MAVAVGFRVLVLVGLGGHVGATVGLDPGVMGVIGSVGLVLVVDE